MAENNRRPMGDPYAKSPGEIGNLIISAVVTAATAALSDHIVDCYRADRARRGGADQTDRTDRTALVTDQPPQVMSKYAREYVGPAAVAPELPHPSADDFRQMANGVSEFAGNIARAAAVISSTAALYANAEYVVVARPKRRSSVCGVIDCARDQICAKCAVCKHNCGC